MAPKNFLCTKNWCIFFVPLRSSSFPQKGPKTLLFFFETGPKCRQQIGLMASLYIYIYTQPYSVWGRLPPQNLTFLGLIRCCFWCQKVCSNGMSCVSSAASWLKDKSCLFKSLVIEPVEAKDYGLGFRYLVKVRGVDPNKGLRSSPKLGFRA